MLKLYAPRILLSAGITAAGITFFGSTPAAADFGACGDFSVCVDGSQPGSPGHGGSGGSNPPSGGSGGGSGGGVPVPDVNLSDCDLNLGQCGDYAAPGEPGQQQPPTITPDQAAAVALARMNLPPFRLRTTPELGATGLVGLPTWLWTDPASGSWAPAPVEDSVEGLTVTLAARVTHVVWDMGDGSQVTCTTPGTPYRPEYRDSSSPDCGYTYTRTSGSQPGNAYAVSATAYWAVHWTAGGAEGDAVLTRQSASVPVRVGELQVLN